MQDNPLFATAADFIHNTSRHVFLTGKAGTGKTTFLKHIRETTRKKCVVVAPTGVAAINAGGVTMHSLFQLPLGPFLPIAHKFTGDGITDQYTLFKNIRVSDRKRELFRDLELLIIDEVSMVRCDMLDATDAILRYFRKMPHTPFGGVQVLYIGDLFQLPPVASDDTWSMLRQYYKSPFFFHSRAVEEAPPVYIELKKIYRQNEQSFIDILNRIRNNEATAGDLSILNDRGRTEPRPGCKYVTLTTHNYKADRINAEALQKLPGKVYEFKGVVDGDFPEKNLPTDPVLQLKEGAQVMFIRNDKSEERRYYNGKLATVKSIDADSVSVILDGSGEELVLEQETWNNIRYSYDRQEDKINEEKLGSFTQYPVRLAWAITIHKSQGLTFENAIIDAGDSFAHGQVYVALSRCTSLDGLICQSKIHPSAISTDPLILEFARKEADERELKNQLEQARRDFEHEQLTRAFDLGKLKDALRTFRRYLEDKTRPSKAPEFPDTRLLLTKVGDLQTVAEKFRQQMKMLVDANDEERLRERIQKAIDYFAGALVADVLTPVETHIASLKGVKKIKQYLREVYALRDTVRNSIRRISEVQYRGEDFKAPGLPEIIQVPAAMSGEKKPKREKGASLKETLSLFKSGLKTPEIAKRRGLAVGTIESHMARLISAGELDIYEYMEESRVDNIVAVIRKLRGVGLHPVKEKLGDGFTYGEIRAVMSHLQALEQ